MRSLPIEIESELEKASMARTRANEGQARVCARRAAGLAAREYLLRRGESLRNTSAYDLLQLIRADPAVPAQLQRLAEHLTVRVDETFRLPPGMDLVAEARELCLGLVALPPHQA